MSVTTQGPLAGTPADRAFALALGVVLTAIWIWWALSDGAFFGTVFYPGAALLYVTSIGLLLWAPRRGSLRLARGPRVALAALVGLGVWTLLGALWSPAPDVAIGDAQRVLAYATSFGLGLWLCLLLGRRLELSMLPLTVAGAVAGLVTAVALIGADGAARFVESDGSLEFPLGYRNANAAFFLIALWPAISLAANPSADWRLRGAMAGTATLCLELGFLSQSRGSVVAIAPALFLWLVFSPWRLRSALWLAGALGAAAVALPWLSDVYGAASAGTSIVESLHDAGWALLVTSGGSACLGALAARLEPAPRSGHAAQPVWRALAGGIAAIAVAAALVLAVTGTDPLDWIGQRASEFRTNTSPELAEQESRFGVNASSERGDLWRVALGDGGDNPLLGQGPGAFQFSYLLDGRTQITPRDAHSVEMELFGELGVPGLALFLVAVAGAAAGLLAARRLGPGAAALSAAAVASGAYWLVHTSIDWFWAYPALTAPALALLGSAAAPAVLDTARRGRRRHATFVAVVAGALALATVPLFLSERYVNSATSRWRSDLDGAYSDLGRAQALNPFSDFALLTEGVIAREAGDRERALQAFQEASERRPEEWASHYFIGLLLIRSDPQEAADELEIAAELNPRGEDVSAARERLETPGEAEDEGAAGP